MNKSTRLSKKVSLSGNGLRLWGVAASLHNLGVNKRMKGDFDEAESFTEEVWNRIEIGNKLGIAQSYSVLTVIEKSYQPLPQEFGNKQRDR